MSSKANKSKSKKINSANKIRSTKVNDKYANNKNDVNSSGQIQDQNASATIRQSTNQANACTTHPIVSQNERLHRIVPKLERASTSFITRRITKLYGTLTQSNETSSADTVDGKKVPIKFIRSFSSAAISLRKDYRFGGPTTALEQLREEDGHADGINDAANEIKSIRSEYVATVSKHKSSTLLSTFKRTFSLTPSKRKSGKNASLLSLQQLDAIESHDDRSFVDYDPLNTYGRKLMQSLSMNDVNGTRSNRKSMDWLCERWAQNNNNNNLERNSESSVKMRSKDEHRSRLGHRYSLADIIHTEPKIANANSFNSQSKRWSNPCISNCVYIDSTAVSSNGPAVTMRSNMNRIKSDSTVYESLSLGNARKLHSANDVNIDSSECRQTNDQIVSIYLLCAYSLFYFSQWGCIVYIM